MTTMMNPGTYFIGDPCYVIPEEEWIEFINEHSHNGFEFKNRKCWFDNTKYGDGGYLGNNNKEYSVDAGIIGVTPIELAIGVSKEKIESLGSIETFDEPFSVSCNDGFFTIGNITIKTNF